MAVEFSVEAGVADNAQIYMPRGGQYNQLAYQRTVSATKKSPFGAKLFAAITDAVKECVLRNPAILAGVTVEQLMEKLDASDFAECKFGSCKVFHAKVTHGAVHVPTSVCRDAFLSRSSTNVLLLKGKVEPYPAKYGEPSFVADESCVLSEAEPSMIYPAGVSVKLTELVICDPKPPKLSHVRKAKPDRMDTESL